MKKEIDAAKYEMTPLMVAASNGELKSVLEVLATGCDVNATDNQGGTALMYAAMHKHLDVVNLLLEVGANATQKTNKGLSAVDFAARSKSNEIVRLLNEHIEGHFRDQSSVDLSKLNFIERFYEKHVTNEVAVGIIILPIVLVIFRTGKVTSDGLALGMFLVICLPILWRVSGKRSAVGSALTILVCLLLIIFGIL